MLLVRLTNCNGTRGARIFALCLVDQREKCIGGQVGKALRGKIGAERLRVFADADAAHARTASGFHSCLGILHYDAPLGFGSETRGSRNKYVWGGFSNADILRRNDRLKPVCQSKSV
jgi:hypothetical protein